MWAVVGVGNEEPSPASVGGEGRPDLGEGTFLGLSVTACPWFYGQKELLRICLPWAEWCNGSEFQIWSDTVLSSNLCSCDC